MERLLESLVFCEAPLDFAYGALAGNGAKLTADARAGDVSSRPAEGAAKTHHVSIKPPAQRQAECALAFDGLNCFETIVMPGRSSC